MSRKIWVIVIAVATILFVNNLQVFGRGGVGSFIDWMLTLFIIYRAYVLYKKYSSSILPFPAKAATVSKAPAPVRNPNAATGSTASQLRIVALIFLFVLVIGAYQIVGAGGFNFFVWGDHLLGTGNGNLPIMMWALAGLFFGAMVGSLVIWWKYHIKFQWCLVTIIPFFSVLFLLQALSDPLQSIEPRAPVVAVDSTRTKVIDSTPVIAKRRRHQTTQPVTPADTAEQPVVAAAECATQSANVSINARADSVNIFYRTAGYRNGPWGSWKSIFIPQLGQFSLTDGGQQVRANGLQYYYETKSVFTRSAQNPYTRLLCEGQLVIDTY